MSRSSDLRPQEPAQLLDLASTGLKFNLQNQCLFFFLKLGMVAYACNSSSGEMETWELWSASLDYLANAKPETDHLKKTKWGQADAGR